MPPSSSCFSPSSYAPTILSKCTVYPHQNSTMGDLKLSISDLNMLRYHYIQKGCLFTIPSLPSHTLIPHITTALSRTLTIFPPLAGRLTTHSDGHIFITCNDAGVHFIHSSAIELSITDLISTHDVPHIFNQLFPFHQKISHTAHSSPVMAVQLTELNDGVFIGCAVCHAVVDGTSFWNFFNTFAAVSRGATTASFAVPDFRREHIMVSDVVLRLMDDGNKVVSNPNVSLRERIFSFSRDAIQRLKARANNGKVVVENDISSFMSLCALVWRAVMRARNLAWEKTTTFRMAVNIRNRVEPKLGEYYFGNAIQGMDTCALVGHVVGKELRWCAEELNRNARAYGNDAVMSAVEDWERKPRFFKLGNHEGTMVQMGSSPRLPMYNNDFGWGRPVAVRSGGANKFDGKMSAFPAREGGGAVDLEVVLAPDVMARLELDDEFMMYACR